MGEDFLEKGVQTLVRAKVRLGAFRAHRQLGFLAMVFAHHCAIWFDTTSGCLQVDEPKGGGADWLMRDASHAMRGRFLPSYLYDQTRHISDMLANAAEAYGRYTGQLARYSATVCVHTAAVRSVERFCVWLSRHAPTLLSLLGSVDPMQSSGWSEKKRSRVLGKQRVRQACLRVLIPHVHAKARLYYFHRLSERVLAKLATDARTPHHVLEDTIGRMTRIEVPMNGASATVHLHTTRRAGDQADHGTAITQLLLHTMPQAFDTGDARYRVASERLAESIADGIARAAAAAARHKP